LKKGQDFLAQNSTKRGVTTLPSGVQYLILKKGRGAIPKDDDDIVVHYHGTLLDGTVFDSSVERGEPSEFKVSAVIEGWKEILQLMPVGSKWRIFIPSNLAYGEHGAGGLIGSNAILIFELELISIK